jgi:hypothetical protein
VDGCASNGRAAAAGAALKARGLSLREIGPQVDCLHQTVALIARRAPRRPVRQDRWYQNLGG